ncbi:methyltransferase domain-containing protein [Paraburkholderia sp. RL17-337-BIB-A]|uniref:methyltransferase domain-containing protein n=1 Tax=Paraburkholderia sp. RL17-337-BIB-A TaxID=3031636 RepID=UPI0038B95C46
MTEINSNAYWEARFAGNWQASGGPAQSRFFSNIALRVLPEWVVGEIRRNRLTIADWGCGEGDGTDVWAAYAPVAQITGVDFSTVAINTAKNRYPEVQFLAENWLADGADGQQFDVVYSSNVMEHFHDPQKVLGVLCQRAKRAIILVLPYREVSRHSEHFFTFTPNNIPIAVADRFRLVFSKVIDCTKISNSHWPGEQIVLVYIDSEWGDALKLTLNESSTECDSKDAEIASLKTTITELDGKSGDKEQRYLEEERRYLEEIRSALSNLGDLHQRNISAEREHAERIDALARREHELTEKYGTQILAAQSELSKAQNELRSSGQKWFSKLREQDFLFAAKNEAAHSKLIQLQQRYSSLADEKNAQAEIFERKIAELRDSTEQQQREQTQAHTKNIELIQRSAEKQRVEQSEFFARELLELEYVHAESNRELAGSLASELHELAEQQRREQTQAHTKNIELIHLSAEKQRVEQSESFARQLLELEDEHAQRERELVASLISIQEESNRANNEWQNLLRIQQDEARERLAAFKARESGAVEMYGARERELNALIAQKDKTLHALASYLRLLDQWRCAVETSSVFRLLSFFSRRMRQSLPRLHAMELALAPSNNQSPAPDSDGVEYKCTTNCLRERNTEEMSLRSVVLENSEIKTVDGLLALQGAKFIDAAYRTILDREPDHAGMSYYISRLQTGVSKVEILSQIRASDEAKSARRILPRLNETILRTKWSRVPLLGWLAPRTERTHYKVRAIEQSLFEIRQANTRYVPHLEREIAEKSRHIEGSAGVIADLQQQLASKDAELAGTKQILAEVTSRLDQFAHNTDLSWTQFQTQILSRRDEYKGIFIQELVIDWNVPLYQRPQHIATAFGRLGYLVIFRTGNWGGDNVNGCRQVEKNVWVTNCAEASSIENAVYSFYSTAYANTPEIIQAAAQKGAVVYEYIDHIDPMISGSADNIRRLVSVKDYAFSGGVHFVVASAKKLEQEAIEAVGADRVILAQNGVDTGHYRNPVHQTTVLPESFVQFRMKYKKIVGYFGAIAPWLWYEAIEKLTAARPDLGFVFIGPDYYGGVNKLPVRDNVLYLGAIDYKILPAYARQFDVCFIPFAPGEIAKTTSPLKLFEYFALEKPVVTTSDMAECVSFPEVFAGDSARSLSAEIDKAFRVKDDKAFKARLSELADQNSWMERARAMEEVFEFLGAKQ